VFVRRPARSTVLRIFGLGCIFKNTIQKKIILKNFWGVAQYSLVAIYTQETGLDLGSGFIGKGWGGV